MNWTWRRWTGGLVLAGMLVGLAGCQLPFPRACLVEENCERQPVNR